jgi:hypothetical protein
MRQTVKTVDLYNILYAPFMFKSWAVLNKPFCGSLVQV